MSTNANLYARFRAKWWQHRLAECLTQICMVFLLKVIQLKFKPI